MPGEQAVCRAEPPCRQAIRPWRATRATLHIARLSSVPSYTTRASTTRSSTACTGGPPDARLASMHLDLRGHPLHTRCLSITLVQRADGRLDVHGEIVDLRKRGFVPVAGDLQPSGVVHHM